MSKVRIGTVQFYISHTCNFSCPNCLSYNNFAIKGHDKFEDYKDTTIEWSKILQPDDMSIIGGEPLSNPDVYNWVIETRKLFPDCKDFKVCSNGLLISKHVESIPLWWDANVILEVSAHTDTHFKKACNDIESILVGKEYKKLETPPAGSPRYYKEDYDVFYTIDNRVIAMVAPPDEFKIWGVNKFQNNQWEMFDSNPKIAHMSCISYDCHYIYKGQMYKCGTIVGAQEFVKNYNVKKDHADLIKKYIPINYNDTDVKEKLSTLTKQPIEQCRLCPIHGKHQTILDTDVKKNRLGLTTK